MTLGPIDRALDAELDKLTRPLRRRGGDWLVRAERAEQATAAVGRDEVGTTSGAWIEVVVYDDGVRGRGVGVARTRLDSIEPGALIDEAVARARLAPGEPWQSPAAAGPARAELASPALLVGAVDERAVELAAGLVAPGITGAVTVARTETAMASSSGQRLGWRTTMVDLACGVGGQRWTARRRAFSVDDARAWLNARRDAATAQQHATPLAPGAYEVVLAAEAMARDGDLGVWRLLAAQADGAMARAGLVMYSVGGEVCAGAATVDEPLDVMSDGARPFGLTSAPVGDGGEAVRRFAVVRGGRAAGLGLDAREARLRGVEPNGGVRELVVGAGGTAASAIGAGGVAPRLHVVAVRWLELDVGSGQVVGLVELARLGERWVTGGVLRGDGLAWLARSQRSREVGSVGSVHGPIAFGLGVVEIG